MQTRPRSSSNERASETSEGRGGGGSKFFAPSAARRPKPTLETTTRFSDVSWQPALTREPVNRLASLGSSGAVREREMRKKENLLANTLFPRLSKMCSDLQKSRPPAGHGVSIAHSLHICEQKGRGGKKKIGTVSSGCVSSVNGEPIDRRSKLSIVFQSLIRYQGERREGKSTTKEFADSRRSNIWITDVRGWKRN